MELKFLPSLLGAESLWLAMSITEVVTDLYAAYAMKRYTPCATAEHEIKRTPVASPASFWYFVDHFHREQSKSVYSEGFSSGRPAMSMA